MRSASQSNNYAVDNLYPLTTDISYGSAVFEGLSDHFPTNSGGYYVIGVVGQNTGLGVDYYRWLYTAFTRASEKLYLVNWSDKQSE